jgi:hypothetical protein
LETGHVAVKDAPGTDFHHHENIEALKASSDRDHEIAVQQGSAVVKNECVPSLRVPTGPRIFGGPVGSHRSRRDTDTELQP